MVDLADLADLADLVVRPGGVFCDDWRVESLLNWSKCMKPIILAAVAGMALASLPAVSMAACDLPSVRVATAAAMTALLEGNTVCVPAGNQPTMDAQELHQAGGALIDYKRGPGHPIDPTKQVGSWTVTGERGVFVAHKYGVNVQYTYSVWANSDRTHSFCRVNSEVKARIKIGGGPC